MRKLQLRVNRSYGASLKRVSNNSRGVSLRKNLMKRNCAVLDRFGQHLMKNKTHRARHGFVQFNRRDR
jgi:hypothetical protein